MSETTETRAGTSGVGPRLRPPVTGVDRVPPRRYLALFVLLHVVVMGVCLTALWPIATGAAVALANSASADKLALVAGMAVVLVVLGMGRSTTGDR